MAVEFVLIEPDGSPRAAVADQLPVVTAAVTVTVFAVQASV